MMKRIFLGIMVVLIVLSFSLIGCGTSTSSLEDVKWLLIESGPAAITMPVLPDTGYGIL